MVMKEFCHSSRDLWKYIFYRYYVLSDDDVRSLWFSAHTSSQMHNTAVQKFSFSRALQNYMLQWPVFMRISWKNSDFNFLVMQNFVQQKFNYFEWMRNFVHWYAKIVLSCKTTQLFHKRIDCFVDTLVLRMVDTETEIN